MKSNNISTTVELNLCTSCGVCKGVCPKESISWKKNQGMYLPSIDKEKCTNCGLCLELCPGICHKYGDITDAKKATIGVVANCYNAWSNNKLIRHCSASGGVTTTIVNHLINSKEFDVAFTLSEYNYDNLLKTTESSYNNCAFSNSDTQPKSRYLPVSHENAVKYITKNKNKKVILIGTSCAIRGIRNVIEKYNLNQDNYLLIGLFCDKIYNYNVFSYFSSSKFCNDKVLKQLHFKNKDSGGWPGNMKFIFSDDTSIFQDKSIRIEAKKYFMPEKCIYCVDKLNVCADISLGDNYTEKNSSELGSNSIIIRTNQGKKYWELSKSELEYHSIVIDDICRAQGLDIRLEQLNYALLKEKESLKRGYKLKLNDSLESQNNPYEYSWALHSKKQQLSYGDNFTDEASFKPNCNSKNFLQQQFERIQRKLYSMMYKLRY